MSYNIYIYRSRAYTGGVSTTVDAWEFGVALKCSILSWAIFQEFIFTPDPLNTSYKHEPAVSMVHYLHFKYTVIDSVLNFSNIQCWNNAAC